MSNRTEFKFTILATVFCLLLFAACKKDNQAYNPNYQYNLYPIDSGHYVIYDVDSILYTYSAPVHTNDTVHYQWMQVMGDTFTDNLGNVNYKIYCYRRPDSLSQWTAVKLAYAIRTVTNMQIIEDDLRFIKLAFPPQLNETWNGNIYIPSSSLNDAYSAFANWNYFYENVDTSYSYGNISASNAVVVSDVNTVNLINKTVRTEIYAPNIGLIYENYEILSNNNLVPGAWDSIAQTGFSIYMRAVQYNP